MHPDIAWSRNYVAPAGLPGEPCRHFAGRRMKVGPTGSKRFMILADTCGWCGHVMRSAQDLSWQEYSWVRRLNASTSRAAP